MNEQGRPTAYSRVTLSKIMTAVDVNLYGTVHGGVLMLFVDDVAGAAAARHSGGTAVTAAIDEIVFLEPVRVGDLVHAYAQVNWTGSSSMEVGVKLVAERWDSAESEPVTVATAYLVFVAIDVDGKPRPVPPVIPGDVDDERRFREALIRRQHRLDRRAAIQQARAETARGETARGETARGETARGETARGEAGRDATGGETGGTRAE